MKINLNELSYKDKIIIDKDIIYPKEYYENTDIKDLKNIHVNGFLYQNEVDEYMCNLDVAGTMTLLDSVSLEKIDYDFSFNINEILEENTKNNKNVLDIMELLWQNIVLEVPIRFTKEDADNLSGDNWQVINESKEEEKIDPRMQKLYDYYNKGGE